MYVKIKKNEVSFFQFVFGFTFKENTYIEMNNIFLAAQLQFEQGVCEFVCECG